MDGLAIGERSLVLAYTGLEVLLRERSTRTLLYAEELCRAAASCCSLWCENLWQVIECQALWWRLVGEQERLVEEQWDLELPQEEEQALEPVDRALGCVGAYGDFCYSPP